jgi:ubiquinone/menaquinone biosynthesis C-methylase UbiE
MLVNNYKIVAQIYNHLMNDVQYDIWANYIFDIYNVNAKKKNDKVLEIAAGSGIIAGLLEKRIKNLIITDISYPMLLNSMIKAPKVCCDMKALPFKNTFTFIYSTFDSINYLLDYKELKAFFRNIEFILEKDGCFTFDVALENNSYVVEKELNREGVYNGYFYSQSNKYYKRKRIHENTFYIIAPDGKHFEEIHLQKIYRFDEYFKALEGTKLYVKDCYNAFTFDEANAENERVQFVLKKR